MAGEIATAFVRIRPNTAGFKSEAETGVKSSLLGVGKILGGVFAVGGAIEGIKTLASAAAEHQAEFSVLERVMKNAGVSATVMGQNIEELLMKEGRLKGFNDEQLAQSFLRLVAVTHDSGRAYKDLGLAEDIARARHYDLATAALALSKAEQGSVTALTRLGIVVPKVGAAELALKKQHDDNIASGVRYTGQIQEQYKAQLAAAQASDNLARRSAALQLIQQRFGGAASTFAKSSAGEFARFSQELHQLEEQIGFALLPGLTRGATELGTWIEHLRASGSAASTAKQLVHDAGEAFHLVAAGAELAGPPLIAISHALLAIANSGVGGPLIAIAIGAKAISIGFGLAAASARRLAAILPTIAVEEDAIVVAGNPFAAITVGAAAAGFGVYKLIEEIKRAHREEERFQNALTTPRALALEFYADRVKALEKNLHLGVAEAQKRANDDTFKHTGIWIHQTAKASSDAASKISSAGAKGAASLKDQLAAEKNALDAVNSTIKDTQSKLSAATDGLRQAEQNLADTIAQGNQQIADSVRSAEANLFSIGNTLSDTIQKFLDAVGRLGAPDTNPQSAQFRRLREEIGSGKAAPGAARAAAELANQIQESQAVSTQTDAAGRTRTQRQFADLVDEFNKGAITLAGFNRRVAGILASDGISYKRAGQVLGVAFADGFQAQVRGLREQAGAIASTPASRRAGITGQDVNVVRPLDTIAQVQRQIAQAQRARDEKALEVSKDQKKLAQLEEAHARIVAHETTTQTGLQRQMVKKLDSIAANGRRSEFDLRKWTREQQRIAKQGAARVAAEVGREARIVAQIGGP